MDIPMSGPDITQKEVLAINRVLATPHLALGPHLQKFEKAFASYTGTRDAIAVSSGTAGLHLCMIAAGVGPGDEVITTPYSFIASANCILYVGATPVFVDVDPQTLNMDVHQVEERITPRTKALLPVHVFGQPCDMAPLMDIARRHNLTVIEDACEAIGAEYQGRKVGTFGRASVFAFYPNKQMTTGEGGVIVTDDPAWADLLRSLRNQGRGEGDVWLMHQRLGYNYRLDEMSCALGLAQMERIEELLQKRERVAQTYTRLLRGAQGVHVPYVAPQTTRMSWFLYVVRLTEKINRDKVRQWLQVRGVPTRPYFPPIHLQPFYRQLFGYLEGNFRMAETAGRSSLALPFSGVMTPGQIEHVCEALQDATHASEAG
ncbi:MAG: DegT/DnrJ/EryC1/StrS family aminotransferase [Chloroflexi bacterium]|nr:DegT/DnrJ/EryC1/StrS family aminotransferase [Chloroflexota bacterium]